MNLGWTELLLIFGIGLIFFGPSRLPGLGKSLGEAIRGFKKGINTDDEEVKEARQQLHHQEKVAVDPETIKTKTGNTTGNNQDT